MQHEGATSKPERLRPKKALGQHFLQDPHYRARIADAVQPLPGERVLEVGPGEGALTDLLLAREMPLTAVEVDPDAARVIGQRYGHLPFFRLVEKSILDYTPDPSEQVLAGNLPYNLSSPIFFWMLDHRAQFRASVAMVQLEVAQRIAAPPGSRTYGILSVLLGAYYEVKLLFRVPPGAFRPPPKVQSAVLGLHRLPQPRCGADTDYPTLKLVTKTAFGQRRKTLANALKPLGLVPPPAWAGLRPENLSPEQFGELARMYRPSPTS